MSDALLFPLPDPPRKPRAAVHPLVAHLSKADRALHRVCLNYRRGFLEDFNNDPTNTCWMMSTSLQGWLSFAEKVESELVEAAFHIPGHEWDSVSHFYLRRDDGTIIDATGDQFNPYGADLPAVYIGLMPEIYQTWLAPAPTTERRAAS